MLSDPKFDLGLNSNLDGVKFCCCSGDNCNSDISTNVTSAEAEMELWPDRSDSGKLRGLESEL
jgi:hypothetical protein